MAYLPKPYRPSQFPQNLGQSSHFSIPITATQQHQVSPVLPVTSQFYSCDLSSAPPTRPGSDTNINIGNYGTNGNGQGQPFPLPFQLDQLPPPPPEVNRVSRPWWIWAFATYDVLEVIAVAARLVYMIVNRGIPANADREKFMFYLFGMLITLLVQITGGMTLFYGLASSLELTTLYCIQGWIYAGYFLIFEKSAVLLHSIYKHSVGTFFQVGETEGSDDPLDVTLPPTIDDELDDNSAVDMLGMILGKFAYLLLRSIAVFAMRRFLNNMKGMILYSNAEGEQQRRVGVMQRQRDPSANASPIQPQAMALAGIPGIQGVLPIRYDNLSYAPQLPLSNVMTTML